MKIRFNKHSLTEAVSYALCAASTKNTMVSIQGLLIETLDENTCRISAYDLEKGIRIVIEAEIIEAGSCIVNAQRFNQIVKMMPENTVDFTINGEVAVVSSGKTEFELLSMNGSEFPSLPELDSEFGFGIKQKVLYNMVYQTIFAVSQSNQRPIFTGVLFDINKNKITVVGCDGYRLAVKENLCELDDAYEGLVRRVVIPGKTLSELMKIIGENDDNIRIKLTNKHVIFEIKEKNLTFFSRLLEGEYIDYDRLIPKQFNTTVIADSELLLSSFERASLVSDENTSSGTKSYVKLNVTESSIEISSVSANGKVRDEVLVEKDGSDIEIGFSCRYVMDSLKACRCEKVKLSLASPLISMLVEPAEEKENEKLTMLVLPIKLR